MTSISAGVVEKYSQAVNTSEHADTMEALL